MPHSTAEKFGFPDSLIAEYQHWLVLLRPNQTTLGSLALVSTSQVKRASLVPADAYAELASIKTEIESTLAEVFGAEKFNYLMLMMVDPHVHYHIIPRYSQTATFCGRLFPDDSWPSAPDLSKFTEIDVCTRQELLHMLKTAWPKHSDA